MSDFASQLEFTAPDRLGLLVFVLVLLIFVWRSRSDMNVWRRLGWCFLRGGAVAAIVLSLAGLQRREPVADSLVVLVADASPSVGKSAIVAANQFAQGLPAGTVVHRIAFGATPSEVGRAESFPAIASNGPASNPADALLLGAASVPADRLGQIVVFSDGLQTAGDVLSAALGVGMPVSVVPVDSFDGPEVSVGSITAPRSARPAQSFALRATLLANRASSGTVQLLFGGSEKESRPVALQPGSNPIEFRVTVSGRDHQTFEIRLNGFDDRIAANNRRAAIVYAENPPRVLIVSADRSRAARLEGMLGQTGVDVASADRIPPDLASLDLLVLLQTPPKSIGAAEFTAIERFVQNGGGLIATGDETTWDLASYGGGDLERVLPLQATVAHEEPPPSLSMTLVIDRSLSMEKEDRLNQAKAAAKAIVEVLTERDSVGVIAFGSQTEWITEILPAGNKRELNRRIDTLTAEGQTNMYPALEKAFLALELSEADRRHIILLTDGVSTPGEFQRLARDMKNAGITVSTVAIGAGADHTILKAIATVADGSFRECEDPRQIRDVLVQETRSAAQADGPPRFQPFVLRSLPSLPLAQAPELIGAAAMSPKTNAEALLFTDRGDPVLAWWRYGAGVSVALASDVSRSWNTWTARDQFWSGLVGLATRQADAGNVQVAGTVDQDTIHVTLDGVDEAGELLNGAAATLVVNGPDVSGHDMKMTQTAPGMYAARVPCGVPGTYLFDVRLAASGGQSTNVPIGVSVDYPDEFRLAAPDVELLKKIAAVSGGKFAPAPGELTQIESGTAARIQPLWPALLLAAVVFFFLDIGWRRRFGF